MSDKPDDAANAFALRQDPLLEALFERSSDGGTSETSAIDRPAVVAVIDPPVMLFGQAGQGHDKEDDVGRAAEAGRRESEHARPDVNHTMVEPIDMGGDR